MWLTAAFISLGTTSAYAQDFVGSDTKPARSIKLDSVCAESLARFCPDLEATPGQTRNQMICLKPYRSSLPLSCRSAVKAVMR